MSRFLFVVPPLAGHVNPAAAVARVLHDRGHSVGWVGSETYLRPRVGQDAYIHPTGLRPYRGQHDRGARAIKSLWDGFVVPFARFMLPAVAKAADTYRPDLMVVDQHALAGAVVAHHTGRPWATLCPQVMELTQPFQDRPKIDAWIRGKLTALAPAAGVDLRFSPHLVVAFTGTALAGSGFPDHFVLVGPATGARPPVPDFPWHRMDPRRRLILVTMGTLAQDIAADFYGRMARALQPMADRVQAILVAPAEALPDPPDHVLVVRQAPVLELMPRLAGVVCHGGVNTTCEALAHGVPVLVAPIKHDQPIVASQVAAAGAGIRVHFDRSTPDRLREAVTGLLDDPSYRVAAERVRASFAAAGGAAAAADRLAAVVAAGETPIDCS
jgi:MGT family glycosyltransferase